MKYRTRTRAVRCYPPDVSVSVEAVATDQPRKTAVPVTKLRAEGGGGGGGGEEGGSSSSSSSSRSVRNTSDR
ncbi:hypothetical protein INR49_010670 [Caranx melampygus]|nr:hypothetical protein INR49_010670 [Caranx melampygus]